MFGKLTKMVISLAIALMSISVAGGQTVSDYVPKQPVAWNQQPFRFITDRPLERSVEVRNELMKLIYRLENEFGLPRNRKTIYIHLFRDQENYQKAILQAIPRLKRRDIKRAGLFLQREGVPYIFVFWRSHDQLLTSLRHEMVHAIINSSVGEIPIWLDEGLAMYYQNGRRDGWEQRLADILSKKVDEGWYPNLTRLEKMHSMSQMNLTDYAEAWSWVHLLMTDVPKGQAIIAGFLADRRRDVYPLAPMSQRLIQQVRSPHSHWYSHFNVRPTSRARRVRGGWFLRDLFR